MKPGELFEKMPKRVMWVVLKHMAAHASGQPEESLESGAWVEHIRKEWETLHQNGLIDTKPPRGTP